MAEDLGKHRDIKTLQRLLLKAEKKQQEACAAQLSVHTFLARMGERYGSDLGVDVQSVVPKDPD